MRELTDLREIVRGAPAPDWEPTGGTAEEVSRVEGVDLPERVAWIELLGTALPLAGVTWKAIDADPSEASRADQEILVHLEFGAPAGFHLGVRVVGTDAAITGYFLEIDLSAALVRLRRRSGGAWTTLASLALVLHYEPLYLRLRVNSAGGVGHTNLSARAWPATDAEPATWLLTATDDTLAGPGRAGIFQSASSSARVRFVGLATGGDSAPGPAELAPSLASLLANSSREIEATLELQGSLRLNGLPARYYFSERLRRTGPSDWPPDADLPGLLVPGGSLATDLSDDPLLAALADAQPPSLALRNPRVGSDPEPILDVLRDVILSGGRAIVRLGDARERSHRSFTVAYAGSIDGEPQRGDRVQVRLAPPARRLEKLVPLSRYFGVPVGLRTDATTADTEELEAYERAGFTAAVRVRFATVPALDTPLYRLISKGGPTSWSVGLTVAGRPRAYWAELSGTFDITLDGTNSLADGRWHWLALVCDATGEETTARFELVVDGALVASFPGIALLDPIDQTGLVSLGQNLQSEGEFCDVRLYDHALPLEELRAAMVQRIDGDAPGLLGLWPCDDNGGDVITDYSAAANHASFSAGGGGTLDTNWFWIPTDGGMAELAGKPQPIVLGAIHHGPAEKVDSSGKRLRISDGEIDMSAAIVYSRGSALATPDDWAPAAGGMITSVAELADPVTYTRLAGSVFGSPVQPEKSLAGSLLGEILTRAGILPGRDLATIPLDGALAPWQIGDILAEENLTVAALLARHLSPIGAHTLTDADGRLTFGAIRPTLSPTPHGGGCIEVLGGLPPAAVVGGWTPAASSYSISFWVAPWATVDQRFADDPDTPPQRLLCRRDPPSISANDSIGVYLSPTGVEDGGLLSARFPIAAGPGFVALQAPASATLAWGRWTLCVVVWDNATNTARIYQAPRGGAPALVAEVASTAGAWTGNGRLEIGGNGFAGGLAEVAVWEDALDLLDVADLVSAPPPSLAGPTLARYYPCGIGEPETALLEAVTGATYPLGGARRAPRRIIDIGAQGTASLEDKPLRPAVRVTLAHGKNFRPLADADLLATLTVGERIALKRQDVRYSLPADAAIVERYAADGRTLTFETRLALPRQAAIIARRWLERLKPGTHLAELRGGSRELAPLLPGDEVWVRAPRRGWSGDFVPARVTGKTFELGTRRTRLLLLAGLGAS